MPGSEQKIKDFWQWFEQNQQVLVDEFAMVDGAYEPEETDFSQHNGANLAQVEKVLSEIMDRLHEYDARLFPYCGVGEDGSVELMVTAEGNVAAFDSAHQLIAAAPALEKWTFRALKPRVEDFEAEFVARSIDGQASADMISYAIARHGSETILVLVFDVETEEITEELAYMGLSMVEGLLGEQDLATGFDGIDAMSKKQFEASGNDWPLADLSNLVAEFDRRRLH